MEIHRARTHASDTALELLADPQSNNLSHSAVRALWRIAERDEPKATSAEFALLALVETALELRRAAQ